MNTPRVYKYMVIVAIVIFALVALCGCSTGPRCLRHHTELQYTPRPVVHTTCMKTCTTTTTYQYGFWPVSVCDQYAQEAS